MKKFIMFLMTALLILVMISCTSMKKTEENIVLKKEAETNNAGIDREEAGMNTTPIIESDEENKNYDVGAIGGSNICSIHNFGYHCYPKEIIAYIGEERFREWANNAHSIIDENGCWPDGNLFCCIELFDVPNEVIIEAYQNDFYNHDWDIEAILTKDSVAFENHARNTVESQYDKKMSTEMLLKYRLYDIMEKKTDEKTESYFKMITNNGTNYPVCKVTLYEMISNTSLTKADFEKALGNASSVNGEKYAYPHFDYDLDLLFGEADTLADMINVIEDNGYESKVKLADALLHKDKE
ncbi:MAG: hypothetical protein E7591_04350 [Ruminococcaceae bacterium]|nr:hypothetical protein [Oscillospiraceae bacterium]